METNRITVIYVSGSWNSQDFHYIEVDSCEQKVCLDFSGLQCPENSIDELVPELLLQLTRLYASASVAVTGLDSQIEYRLKRAGLGNRVLFTRSAKDAAEQLDQYNRLALTA